jgi:hypothetical protein
VTTAFGTIQMMAACSRVLVGLLVAGGVLANSKVDYQRHDRVPIVANKVRSRTLLPRIRISNNLRVPCMHRRSGLKPCTIREPSRNIPVPPQTLGLMYLLPLLQVGPYTNPSETYQYLSLPFCEPDEIQHDGHSLGEYLSGDRKVHTDYVANFGGGLSPRMRESVSLHLMLALNQGSGWLPVRRETALVW